MKTYYNFKNIHKIVVYNYKRSTDFWFLSEKRFLKIRIQKEGVYDLLRDVYVNSNEKLKNCKVDYKNKVVYEYPRCVIHFTNGEFIEYYYESYEDALKKAEDIKKESESKYIKIESNLLDEKQIK